MLRICRIVGAVRYPKLFLQDGDQDVNRYGDPYLSSYRIVRRARERLDTQMLLDPLEKQLDLPSASIKPCDGNGWFVHVVGQEDQSLAGIRIDIDDAPQDVGVMADGVDPRHDDGLVAAYTGGHVHCGRLILLPGQHPARGPSNEA